jgi:RNA polymerase sigma factor (sigma-70 family)
MDEREFAAIAERHRRELQIHCYRMVGSVEDSEDLVQETYLRAWPRRSSSEGRGAFRAWLYKIATNACLPLGRQATVRHPLLRRHARTADRASRRVTYVTEGVEAAIEQARAAASGKDVSVMGAEVPQQAIRAGLLDELVIHLIPVLLDDGKRLFDRLGGRVDLERTQVVEAPEGVTHLRFRVIR